MKYYQNCQKRKFSRTPTNLGIISGTIRSLGNWSIQAVAHFQTRQLLLYRRRYSEQVFCCLSIKSKDAVTVSYAIVKRITLFGVCNIVINDQGSELNKLWKMLYMAQQFTPAFMYHCLVACKRIHANLPYKFTPYISRDKSNWEDYLSSIVFSIHYSVNNILGYSPYETHHC